MGTPIAKTWCMLLHSNTRQEDERTVIRSFSASSLRGQPPVSAYEDVPRIGSEHADDDEDCTVMHPLAHAGTKATLVKPLVAVAPAALVLPRTMPTPMTMSRSALFEQHDATSKSEKTAKKVTPPRSRLQTAIMSVVLYGTVLVVGFAVILAAHGDLSINDIQHAAASGVGRAEVSLHLVNPPIRQADLPWAPVPDDQPQWSPEEPKAPPPVATTVDPAVVNAAAVATPAPITPPAAKVTTKKSKTKKHAT